jgi:hypothetical protein
MSSLKLSSLYFRACGIAADGTRVDFPSKSNSKVEIENTLDTENTSENGIMLLVEEPGPDEKAPIDVSAVLFVEPDDTN